MNGLLLFISLFSMFGCSNNETVAGQPEKATRALYGYTGDEKYLTHNSRMCLQIIENFK